MKTDDLANSFGQLLIAEARDRAISGLKAMATRPDIHTEVETALSTLNRLDTALKEVVFQLALCAVDQSLHNALWLLSGNSDFEICYRRPDGSYESLNKHSDGLYGDLLGDDGWIASYSGLPSTT